MPGGIRIDDVRARARQRRRDVRRPRRAQRLHPGDINLTATGQQMRIRYPEGFQSIIDADLSLSGTMAALRAARHRDRPRRAVREALRAQRRSAQPGGGGGAGIGAPSAADAAATFDVQIDAPSALRVENNIAHMVASADLKLQGTYDHPVLFGTRADRARRHPVRRQPLPGHARQHRLRQPDPRSSRIFDIEAETRVRVPEAADLPHHARIHRHDLAHVAEPQFRSAAVERRHRAAAVRPVHRRRPMPSCRG